MEETRFLEETGFLAAEETVNSLHYNDRLPIDYFFRKSVSSFLASFRFSSSGEEMRSATNRM